jgi:hypothetical protein
VAEHKEIRYDRLYVKVPGTDRLRKNAAGRLQHLLNTGWRETERVQNGDYIRVRVERSGHQPEFVRLKEGPPPAPRERRPGGPAGWRGSGGGGGRRG